MKAKPIYKPQEEENYKPGPCRECGSVNTREVANYLTACYTLIYCVDCGHKVHADGKTPKDSQERCRRLWEGKGAAPEGMRRGTSQQTGEEGACASEAPGMRAIYEDDVKQHSGLLEE